MPRTFYVLVEWDALVTTQYDCNIGKLPRVRGHPLFASGKNAHFHLQKVFVKDINIRD